MKYFISQLLILSLGLKLSFAQIVISQFSFGSDYSERDEYVEIYNASSDEIVDISLWKLQCRQTRAMSWRTIAVIPEDTYLPPKSFYLIASKDYSKQEVAPDLIGSFGLGLSMEGSLRLVDFYGSVMDLVGYGAEAPESEKKPVVSIIGQVVLRKDPSVDTNNNRSDFKSQSIRNPKNLSGERVKSKSPKQAEREYKQKLEETDETISENKYIRSEALLSEAKTDYRDGKWLTAYEKTRIALQFAPDNQSIKDFQNKMRRDAKRGMEKSTFVGQDEFYARAFLYYSANDWQNALNALKKILAFNPRHMEAREFYDKVQSLVRAPRKEMPEVTDSKKDEEITIILEPSASTKPTAKQLKLKKTEREKQAAAQTGDERIKTTELSLSDQKADELYEKGLQEFAEGRLTEAIKLWEQVLKINPGHQRAQKALLRARKRMSGQ